MEYRGQRLIGEKPTVNIRGVTGDEVKAETAYGCVVPLLIETGRARWNFKGIGANWSHMAHNRAFWEAAHQPQPPDFVLVIDSDMMFPANALDRLIAHDVDIVGVTYRRRKPPFDLMEYPLDERLSMLVTMEAGIHEWSCLPCGFLLVKMGVIRAMSYPWFYDIPGDSPDEFRTGDTVFGRDARDMGFKVFCDYDLTRECLHIGSVPIPFGLPIAVPPPTQ